MGHLSSLRARLQPPEVGVYEQIIYLLFSTHANQRESLIGSVVVSQMQSQPQALAVYMFWKEILIYIDLHVYLSSKPLIILYSHVPSSLTP